MKKNRKEIGNIRHGYKVVPCSDETSCEAPVSWCQSCNLCLDYNLHYEKAGADGLTSRERGMEPKINEKHCFLYSYRKNICFVLLLLFLFLLFLFVCVIK